MSRVPMHDDLEDEAPRIRPLDATALLITVLLSVLVVYNTVWNQPAGARLAATDLTPAVNGTTKLVVDAGDAGAPSITVRFDPVIEEIQRALSKAGYYSFAIDGVNGKRTRDAIAAYQQANGLDITGEPSNELVDHIKLTQTIIEAVGAPSEEVAISESDQVMQAQTGLSELGYLQNAPDGNLTDETREAIRSFQQDRGLPITGEVSPALLTELGKTSGISQLSAQ